ncbi:hypothetical protein OUZ56_032740 [Daphnia magna]|uniref:Uncharacterized protein n=1 Tax=Daphnia magna TaxID=35525 RepID=A0ABQ9ZWZ5_9CRUS|nr:hypothetical protein OUZ56_032740 [Daphnia magna]
MGAYGMAQVNPPCTDPSPTGAGSPTARPPFWLVCRLGQRVSPKKIKKLFHQICFISYFTRALALASVERGDAFKALKSVN